MAGSNLPVCQLWIPLGFLKESIRSRSPADPGSAQSAAGEAHPGPNGFFWPAAKKIQSRLGALAASPDGFFFAARPAGNVTGFFSQGPAERVSEW